MATIVYLDGGYSPFVLTPSWWKCWGPLESAYPDGRIIAKGNILNGVEGK